MDQKTISELYKGINPQKLPTEWSKYYILYQYRDDSHKYLSSILIVGFNYFERASEFQSSLLGRSDVFKAEFHSHYPRYLLEDTKKAKVVPIRNGDTKSTLPPGGFKIYSKVHGDEP